MLQNFSDFIGIAVFITGLLIGLVNLTNPALLLFGILILFIGVKISSL